MSADVVRLISDLIARCGMVSRLGVDKQTNRTHASVLARAELVHEQLTEITPLSKPINVHAAHVVHVVGRLGELLCECR